MHVKIGSIVLSSISLSIFIVYILKTWFNYDNTDDPALSQFAAISVWIICFGFLSLILSITSLILSIVTYNSEIELLETSDDKTLMAFTKVKIVSLILSSAALFTVLLSPLILAKIFS